ncbi:MAG: ankyrin repeat-containing protein [Acidobacteria bacterium OLB17]|nr:MAG: ankyrin repeat-containing protein [Acidobacteria bacterium OLB17]MCZ2391220.1 tetratricopeptide repeat protein [Acidobacteriota bacterium]
MKRISTLAILIFVAAAAALGQGYSAIADSTFKYVKAGTFGKPSVAKKTQKISLGQVRVHFKTVTSRESTARGHSADVTVYLDSDLTTADLQKLTDAFYQRLASKLNAIGIETVPFDSIKQTEYYAEKLGKQSEEKGADFDGKYGQAWVSVNAFDGPVFVRWRPEGTVEIIGFGQQKKLAKTAKETGGDIMTVDVVLDFASIMLSAAVKQDRQGWFYGDPYFYSDYSIGGLMNVSKSYIYLADQKNGFDQYSSAQPIAERIGYAEKPRQDASRASYRASKAFGKTDHTFTPLIIPATRERYLFAAGKVLDLYADMLAEKFRILRGGAVAPSGKPAEKPKDNTTLAEVENKARQNNDTTAVTTGEMKAAALAAEKAGKYQLAADYYERLAAADPENSVNHNLKRGSLYMDQIKDQKKAIEIFELVIKAAPNSPEGYYNRGTAYVKLQEWKKARKDLDKAIELRPTWVEAYLNRGIVLIYMKKLDDAFADFEKGIQLNPRIPNLYRARALVYKAKGNAALAAADELRAAQIEQGRY